MPVGKHKTSVHPIGMDACFVFTGQSKCQGMDEDKGTRKGGYL